MKPVQCYTVPASETSCHFESDIEPGHLDSIVSVAAGHCCQYILVAHYAHTDNPAGKTSDYFVPAVDHPNTSLDLVKYCSFEDSLPLMQGIDSAVLADWQEPHEEGLVVRSYSQIHLPFGPRSSLGFE